MVLQKRQDGTPLPFTIVLMGKRVRKLQDKLKLPSTFTLDACRHGGMTELEQAGLTDGQGRALSGHRTQRAYLCQANAGAGFTRHQEAPRAPNRHLCGRATGR
jgi:hypothetical protein